MARIGDGGDLLKCSFCGKSQKQVKKLIAGPGVYICDECIDLCNEIIEEEPTRGLRSASTSCRSPRRFEFLNPTSSVRSRPRSLSRSRSTTTTSGCRPVSSPPGKHSKEEVVEVAKSNIP